MVNHKAKLKYLLTSKREEQLQWAKNLCLIMIKTCVALKKTPSIFDKHLMPSVEYLSSFGKYTFQQDGALALTAKITKRWFLAN